MATKIHHSNRMNNLSANDASIYIKSDNEKKTTLYDTINANTYNAYNTINLKEDPLKYKKKVDKLNLRFYIETDKYLNLKAEIEKSQDNLFLMLFKQISVYMEEIEKLNAKLKDKEENDKYSRFKLEEVINF
jgi:hypothetical protein